MFSQIPCSASDAAVWMKQADAKFEMEEHSSTKLLIPQRFNQQGKFEEYFIDACSNDQKDILAHILHCFKQWNEIENNPDSQETFTPLRMTLCGVAASGKSTLINTLVTAICKITQKT